MTPAEEAQTEFIGYLIDHCEGEIITEEFLQFTYSDFLKRNKPPQKTYRMLEEGEAIEDGDLFLLTSSDDDWQRVEEFYFGVLFTSEDFLPIKREVKPDGVY